MGYLRIEIDLQHSGKSYASQLILGIIYNQGTCMHYNLA